jgi:hypothetical protein
MAITVVATTIGVTGANGATTSGIDTTGANLIVLAPAWFTPAADPTISDSKGNTWTALTKRTGIQTASRLYYCVGPTVGSGHTFTVSDTGIYPALGVVAVSGAHASPYHSENGAVNDGGLATSHQPGSVTPPEDGCLVATGLGCMSSSNHAINSGFSETSVDFGPGVNIAGAVGWLIQGTAGAVNPTWSWTTGAYTTAGIAVFKPAAGGGAAKPVLFHSHYLNQGFR